MLLETLQLTWRWEFIRKALRVEELRPAAMVSSASQWMVVMVAFGGSWGGKVMWFGVVHDWPKEFSTSSV